MDDRNIRPSENPRPGTGQQAVRRRRRKKNMTLYYIMVFVIVVAAVLFMSRFVFFRIEEIKISGTDLYTREQIIAACGVNEGDNLFGTDIKEAEKVLSSLMVYADEVKVRRELPSTLKITIKQAVPQYCVFHNGLYFTVSESGRLLETGMQQPDSSLVLVSGFNIKDTTPGVKLRSTDQLKEKILADISDGAKKLEFKGITEIDLTDRTDIKIVYDNRIEVRLGSSYDLYFKLNYTKSVIDSLAETYGDSYEGTLIYHSSTSGMSAIPKDSQTGPAVKPEEPEDDSDDADSSEAPEDTSDETSEDNGDTGEEVPEDDDETLWE